MKVILNNQFEIPNAIRINEITEKDQEDRISLLFHFSESIYENLKNFLKDNNNIITEIKVIKNDMITNILTKYTIVNKIIHHQGEEGEFVEVSIGQDIQEQ